MPLEYCVRILSLDELGRRGHLTIESPPFCIQNVKLYPGPVLNPDVLIPHGVHHHGIFNELG